MANGAGAIGSFLQNFSRSVTLGQHLNLQRQQEQRLAELQKAQMGVNLVQGFRNLLDTPPNLAGPMFESFSKSLGFDPENPQVKLLGKSFAKLDLEQREVFKNYLAVTGAQNPDQVIDFVTQLTRDPKAIIDLFGKVSQFQQQNILQKILSGEPQQGTTSGIRPMGPSTIQESSIAETAPQMEVPSPQSALDRQVAVVENQLAALEQRRQLILQSPNLTPQVKKLGMDQLNPLIDDARQRLGQFTQQRREERLSTQPSQELRDVLKSMGVDPARASDTQLAEARRQVQKEKIAVATAQGRALAEERFLESPLPENDKNVISLLEGTSDALGELRNRFTSEERAEFVGVFRNPALRASQFWRNNKRFAEFQAIMGRVKKSAFDEGGKQLTPFEFSVVSQFVPQGTEISTADFEAKLNFAEEQVGKLRERRLRLGLSSRRELLEEFGQKGRKKPSTPQGAIKDLKSQIAERDVSVSEAILFLRQRGLSQAAAEAAVRTLKEQR